MAENALQITGNDTYQALDVFLVSTIVSTVLLTQKKLKIIISIFLMIIYWFTETSFAESTGQLPHICPVNSALVVFRKQNVAEVVIGLLSTTRIGLKL